MAAIPDYLFYGAAFLSAWLLVEGLYLLFRDARGRRCRMRRRLSPVTRGRDAGPRRDSLYRRPRVPVDPRTLAGRALDRLNRRIARAGLRIGVGRLLLIVAGLSAAMFLLAVPFFVSGSLPAGPGAVAGWGLVSLTVGAGLPAGYLKIRAERRLERFAGQLPDALDIMVRSLRAGHPISAALGLVAEEMGDPVGAEFGLAVDEITYGLDMHDALENMGRRVALPDLQYLVVSVNIQHETGGNLAEVLHGLSVVIRQRFRMFQKIRALSAEGRLSAKVLTVLPFAVGGLIFLGNPAFYLEVAEDPLFLPIFAGVAGLLLGGVIAMHRMVRFRV